MVPSRSGRRMTVSAAVPAVSLRPTVTGLSCWCLGICRCHDSQDSDGIAVGGRPSGMTVLGQLGSEICVSTGGPGSPIHKQSIPGKSGSRNLPAVGSVASRLTVTSDPTVTMPHDPLTWAVATFSDAMCRS